MSTLHESIFNLITSEDKSNLEIAIVLMKTHNIFINKQRCAGMLLSEKEHLILASLRLIQEHRIAGLATQHYTLYDCINKLCKSLVSNMIYTVYYKFTRNKY